MSAKFASLQTASCTGCCKSIGLCLDHVIITFLFLPIVKKLGGKLDVVSYHDEVEGEFRLKLIHDSRLFIIHLTFQYISVQGRKTHHTASVCVYFIFFVRVFLCS